MMDSIYCYFIP